MTELIIPRDNLQEKLSALYSLAKTLFPNLDVADIERASEFTESEKVLIVKLLELLLGRAPLLAPYTGKFTLFRIIAREEPFPRAFLHLNIANPPAVFELEAWPDNILSPERLRILNLLRVKFWLYDLLKLVRPDIVQALSRAPARARIRTKLWTVKLQLHGLEDLENILQQIKETELVRKAVTTSIQSLLASFKRYNVTKAALMPLLRAVDDLARYIRDFLLGTDFLKSAHVVYKVLTQ